MQYEDLLPKKPHANAPTQDEVREYFRYDPETGELFWLKARGSRAALDPAGYVGDRYKSVTFKGVLHNVRNLVWIYHHGVIPEGGLKNLDYNACNTKLENIVPRRRGVPRPEKVSFL